MRINPKKPPSCKYDGKGMSPEAACYYTGADHRSQIARAEVRDAKKAKRKEQRRLDKLACEGEEIGKIDPKYKVNIEIKQCATKQYSKIRCKCMGRNGK